MFADSYVNATAPRNTSAAPDTWYTVKVLLNSTTDTARETSLRTVSTMLTVSGSTLHVSLYTAHTHTYLSGAHNTHDKRAQAGFWSQVRDSTLANNTRAHTKQAPNETKTHQKHTTTDTNVNDNDDGYNDDDNDDDNDDEGHP